MKNCKIGMFVLCAGLALRTQAVTVDSVETLVEAVQKEERWVDIWPGTYDLSGREPMTAPDGTKAYLVITAANCRFGNNWHTDEHWSARDPAHELVIKGGAAARLVYCYGNGRGTQFQHVTFEGGNAGANGNGGVVAFSGIGKGFATNCVFRGAAAANGGATYGLTAYDCLFTNNTARANGGGAVGFAAEGLTNVFVNCVFVDNHAANGGGLYCRNYFQSVKDCVFMDNATTANGGGLYAYATIDVIEGTAFDGNRAVEKGGCLYAESGLETAMGCTFKNGVSDGEFGGVYLSSYGGAFKGCLFESNTNKTATVNGSHVNNAQSATDCIFRGWGDLRVQRVSRCTFDRCVYFAGEGSAEDGLVTFVSWRESGSIENCLFAGCSTSVLIYNKSNKTVPIVNCTFADNTLRHWGKHDGFLFFAHRADAGLPSTNVIVNSIFSGNRVATEASAASGESVPCDFMANATTYKVESCPCLNLVSNAVYVTYDAVYSKNNPTQFSKFRKVADVGFVGMSDPALPPYALREGSRAINRGLNAGWTAEDTDLAGNSRVQGQTVDLGCYESPFDRGLVLVVR